MSKKSVFCIAKARKQAEQIIEDLRDAGFSNDDVSVLFPDKGTTKAPEGMAAGAGAGGVIGGALGWLAGVGALAVPGVGPFIAAGPVLAALSGSTMGATIGGIAGGLIGMGIPELEAKRYEGKVRAGNILLSVHAVHWNEIADAEQIYEDADAEDICAAGEPTIAKKREYHRTQV